VTALASPPWTRDRPRTIAATATPDGGLHHWNDIAESHDWQVLLLGNGLSINVWPQFDYRALLQHAAEDQLTDVDRTLFDGTTNFERVLGDLSTAIRVCEVAGVCTRRLYERYRGIQRALGNAVREVHLMWGQVPGSTLSTIRDVLRRFEWVFTTSYDMLIYWAIGHGRSYAPFKDHFRHGGRCQFDPKRAAVAAGDVPVYYLHGALHLVAGGAGETWKLRQTLLDTILDQFGQTISGDPQARPLLVTEGSAREKLRAIESNGYLMHALERLRTVALPTVVFGSSLGEQDAHLVDALSAAPRPIAVSMLPTGTKRQRAVRQTDLWARLEVDDLYFFDATTHPLGSSTLSAVSSGRLGGPLDGIR
jgi:hypothetical protein